MACAVLPLGGASSVAAAPKKTPVKRVCKPAKRHKTCRTPSRPAPSRGPSHTPKTPALPEVPALPPLLTMIPSAPAATDRIVFTLVNAPRLESHEGARLHWSITPATPGPKLPPLPLTGQGWCYTPSGVFIWPGSAQIYAGPEVPGTAPDGLCPNTYTVSVTLHALEEALNMQDPGVVLGSVTFTIV